MASRQQLAPMPLERALANRRWLYRDEPFPHVTAQAVFTRACYRELEAEFQRILERGFADPASVRAEPGMPGRQFARGMPGYDAYGFNFSPELEGPLRLFVSRPWHDLLAGLFGVNATGHVNAGLHHHKVGSTSGNPHNDLNPAWFVDYESPDGINLARHDICSYSTGRARVPGVVPKVVVRAVAMIFYLNNPPWSQGDGGETALYRTQRDEPEVIVPPINNSLLAFGCTPYSYHSFLSNVRHERNTVIMWLHRSRSEVVTRWGKRAIVDWPRRR
jgi:2OG-Fe(II) oxygenase superfamily